MRWWYLLPLTLLLIPVASAFNISFPSSVPAFYLIDYGGKVVIDNYSFITTAASAGSAWTIYASNDANYYTTLDKQTGVNLGANTLQWFNSSGNTHYYRYLGVYLTAGFSGSGYLEMHFYSPGGIEPTPFSTVSGANPGADTPLDMGPVIAVPIIAAVILFRHQRTP